ncbi:MAG TPA: tyrosine-type recombinase/integrase [Stenomitos sp.]
MMRGYLERLSGAMKQVEVLGEGGKSVEVSRCIYTPHSLRTPTATLLLDAGVDITKVQELLGHKHITTTQIDDKRKQSKC